MWFYPKQLDRIEQKVDYLMGLVQVEQDDLDALDTAFDAATSSIIARIDELVAAVPEPLPPAQLDALMADVEALRALTTPVAVEVVTDDSGT
jgi:hypothetical protein